VGADPVWMVLVGDSLGDIEAAKAAGVHSVGYANKPGKADRFVAAGANIVVTRMADLVPAPWVSVPRNALTRKDGARLGTSLVRCVPQGRHAVVGVRQPLPAGDNLSPPRCGADRARAKIGLSSS
jgi:hypothetical protein